jgi:nucleotide-binding universal stress UspA family protein
MQKILVGYDGSSSAQRALQRVAELARNGTQVTVVTAVPLDVTSLGPEPPEPDEIAKRAQRLEVAVHFLSERGLQATGIETEGNPADVVLQEAASLGADLIVIGTGGKNAVERFVLGSVSDKVVHRAPCDVLVVR